MRLENYSGYDTEDLRRFLTKAFRVFRFTPREQNNVDVVITAAPERSRGCADIGKTKGHRQRLSLAIASPARFSLRRFVRLTIHEMSHLKGLHHEEMDRETLYSLGPIPDWARGTRLRYRGRAPNQIRRLGARS